MSEVVEADEEAMLAHHVFQCAHFYVFKRGEELVPRCRLYGYPLLVCDPWKNMRHGCLSAKYELKKVNTEAWRYISEGYRLLLKVFKREADLRRSLMGQYSAIGSMAEWVRSNAYQEWKQTLSQRNVEEE